SSDRPAWLRDENLVRLPHRSGRLRQTGAGTVSRQARDASGLLQLRPASCSQHLPYCFRIALPDAGLVAQTPAPFAGKPVVLGAPVVFREPPLRLDPALFLHAVKGGVERAFLDQKSVIGLLLDALGNGIPVQRSPTHRLQDQDVKSSANHVQRWFFQWRTA